VLAAHSRRRPRRQRRVGRLEEAPHGE
jgi:hypothetical protein